MKTKKLVLIILVLAAVTLVYGIFGERDRAEAFRPMMEDVNATCGASYGCGLCHQDQGGGGPLTQEGSRYVASGNDPCYFCATVCNPPTQPEICNDGIDNDGDNSVDCIDRDCANDPACVTACIPTQEGKGRTCSDGKDNDCDGRIDCADSGCARNKSCKTR